MKTHTHTHTHTTGFVASLISAICVNRKLWLFETFSNIIIIQLPHSISICISWIVHLRYFNNFNILHFHWCVSPVTVVKSQKETTITYYCKTHIKIYSILFPQNAFSKITKEWNYLHSKLKTMHLQYLHTALHTHTHKKINYECHTIPYKSRHSINSVPISVHLNTKCHQSPLF